MSKVSISGELSLQEPQLHQLRKREFAQKSWESQSQSRCFYLMKDAGGLLVMR